MGDMIRLNNVVLNYPNVFTAKASTLSDRKTHSVAMIFEPNSPELAKLRQAIAAKVAETGAQLQPKVAAPKHDLSKIQVNAASGEDQKPGVVDASNQPIFDHSEIYPGVICNVMIDVYFAQSRGRVCLGLLAVQKVADGERLDNRPDVNNLFAPIPVQGGAPPAQQQNAPAFNPSNPYGDDVPF